MDAQHTEQETFKSVTMSQTVISFDVVLGSDLYPAIITNDREYDQEPQVSKPSPLLTSLDPASAPTSTSTFRKTRKGNTGQDPF